MGQGWSMWWEVGEVGEDETRWVKVDEGGRRLLTEGDIEFRQLSLKNKK